MASENKGGNKGHENLIPFKPGQSGNPNGRPKMPEEVKQLIKANTLKAVQTLVSIMDDTKAKPPERIRAAEVILDRAYGKAVQPIVGDDEHAPVRVDLFDPAQRRKLIDDYINRQRPST